MVARVWRFLPGPSLDGNPVLWREWRRNRSSRLTHLIWLAYFGILSYGGICSVYAIYRNGLQVGPGFGVIVLMLGIGLGLLLLSVTASTSLSEERTCGSLDVLLATPLPTRTILWGKWWGAYRVVPLLALWPVVIMTAFAISKSQGGYQQPLSGGAWVFSVMLMAMIVLVHGAALTSLGLALATWIPRQGRAVGSCVAAYLMVSVGWLILIAALSPRRGPTGTAESLACLSPIFGSIYLLEHLVFQRGHVAWVFAVTILWLLVVAGAAVLLFALTLATFDRGLGRTSDWNDELRFGPEPRPLRQSLASGHVAS